MNDHKRIRPSRCVVIINPASTHYRRSLRFTDQLRKLFLPENFETIETDKKDYKNHKRLVGLLGSKLDENSLLCIAGGDGTISLLINLLLTDPSVPETARKAVILPLWGGNANDLAYTANGPVSAANMENIISDGVVAAAYPLSAEFKHEGKSFSRLAVGYLSLGASAYASELINRPGHRYKDIYRYSGARVIFEAGCVIRALVTSSKFECEIDGVRQKLFDLIMINGSRIAKIYRVPLKITDKFFYEIRIARKHPVIINYALKILHRTSIAKRTRSELSLIVRNPVWFQIDGEQGHMRAHTELTVRPNDQPFYILSTKLG
jgi:hypothetical protein